MNYDDIRDAWNSGDNEPDPVQRERCLQKFAVSLRKQHRNRLIWLSWTFFQLVALTGFVIWVVVSGARRFDLASEWGIFLLLLIPWSVAFLFLKRFLKPDVPLCRGEVATVDVLASAVAANRAARSRLKVIGAMYAILIPVLACSLWQFLTVGKVSSGELQSMVVFFGTVLGVCALGVYMRYRFQLVPQQKQLESLLKQL